MLSEKTDEQLMTAYAEDNIEAFHLLYSRYKSALYRFILRQVHAQAVTEELFQDIWSKIIKNKGSYKVSASFRTFIYQIARNTIIDWFRRKNIQPIDDNDNTDLLNSGDVRDEPSRQLEKEQSYESVIEAIKTLPADQRDVFLLKVEANLSIQEIADVMQVNPETAKSRYRYAVKQLKVLLGQDYDE